MSTQIKRKPVPQRVPMDSKAQFTASPIVQSPSEDPPPVYDFTEKIDPVNTPIIEGEIRPDLDEQLKHLQLETGHENDLPSPTDEPIVEATSPALGDDTHAKCSKFKHALGEIKHFAGGLITYPYEATKHYSIVRHSHGFVFYQGPTTSIAITVFSDQALPVDRKLWLQKKGFSGKAGLRIGTLGSRSAWIDVTPSIDATANQVVPENERAWQRDIAKFVKKAQKIKNLRDHRPYETHIVRIPHVAEDGYFRIVLCTERKVLCPSPVFRYASSSTDPSVLRGASLRTLPLELGIRVGSLVANTMANTAAVGVLQPAVSTVQTAVAPYQYGGVTQWAATTAYDTSGAAEKVDSAVDSVNQTYDEKRQQEATTATDSLNSSSVPENEDAGPQAPYPIRFSAKVTPGTDNEEKMKSSTMARLANVPQDTLMRLSGTYFGWVSFSCKKGSVDSVPPNAISETWLPAVIIVAVKNGEKIAVVEKKMASIHIIRDFPGAVSFSNVKVSLMAMGHIRRIDSSGAWSPGSTDCCDPSQEDIEFSKRALSRETWQPDAVLERIKSASCTRSFTERIADARQAGQKQFDRVPVHRFGVRTDSMGLKDQLIGNGGICIKR